MPSRCASSSIRASTTSRFGTNPSRYSCRPSVTSTVLIPPPHELVEQRLEGDDVGRHALHRVIQHHVVKPRRRHRLVQASPAPVPRLELGARKKSNAAWLSAADDSKCNPTSSLPAPVWCHAS